MSTGHRTIVELLDHPDVKTGAPLPHKVYEVRVNGQPVRVAAQEEGGIEVEFGHREPTIVTLRLLVDELHFIPSDEEDPF